MKVKLSPALSYFPWGSWSREKKRYGTESGPQTESKSTSLQLLAALQPMDQVSAIGQTKSQLLVLFISFPHMTNPCQTQMTPCTNPFKAITGPTSILHLKLFPDHWSETSTRRFQMPSLLLRAGEFRRQQPKKHESSSPVLSSTQQIGTTPQG